MEAKISFQKQASDRKGVGQNKMRRWIEAISKMHLTSDGGVARL